MASSKHLSCLLHICWRTKGTNYKKMRNKAYWVNVRNVKAERSKSHDAVDIILLSLHFSKFTIRLKRYWHNSFCKTETQTKLQTGISQKNSLEHVGGGDVQEPLA